MLIAIVWAVAVIWAVSAVAVTVIFGLDERAHRRQPTPAPDAVVIPDTASTPPAIGFDPAFT